MSDERCVDPYMYTLGVSPNHIFRIQGTHSITQYFYVLEKNIT
jgi:hypothetical protein